MPPPSVYAEEKAKQLRGELHIAFNPQLLAERLRCSRACDRYNNAGEVSRRRLVEMWREIIGDSAPLPPPAATEEADEALLALEPWITAPIRIDYGTNLVFGRNVYINFNAVFVDTCQIRIGSRTLVGPNVSIYSGTHPLDAAVRNGTEGPENGKEIEIGEDCWIGGGVTILAGVRLGRGVVVGAGSVVTKSVGGWRVIAGNPARVIREIESEWRTEEAMVKREIGE